MKLVQPIRRLFSVLPIVIALAIATLSSHDSTTRAANKKQFVSQNASRQIRYADTERTNFPVERQTFQTPHLRQQFPRLGNHFEIVGTSTRRYNCIAWSLGITDRWVNPETGPAHNPLAYMNEMYAELGYRRLQTLDFSAALGKDKVAVYATLEPDGSIGAVSHAARQELDGTWTSKCGALALIRHPSLESLRGPAYGVAVAVYERSVQHEADSHLESAESEGMDSHNNGATVPFEFALEN
jgi:hypothetical protein